ncbi:MAG: hypothetical protein KAW47_05690 [Thermoplasmatales archaeon]|nr:hypothetical protein [Thermoplasmatales archaeon]
MDEFIYLFVIEINILLVVYGVQLRSIHKKIKSLPCLIECEEMKKSVYDTVIKKYKGDAKNVGKP